MANLEHLAILKQGVEGWNEWRGEHQGIVPDLRDADLSSGDLSAANLRGADLRGAHLSQLKLTAVDLRYANLPEVNLYGSDLTAADLSWARLANSNLYAANLRDANLERAYLRGANLRSADLSNTRLKEAILTGADLSDAKLIAAELTQAKLAGTVLRGANFSSAIASSTIFVNVDLSRAIGLDSVYHPHPSSIGIDTLIRSGGRIPEMFLRRAGVPQPFITNLQALIGAMDPIEFYSCFISYSNKDQDFSKRLYADLQAKNIRCFFAPEDLKIGDRFADRIEESIRLFDKLMVVLSCDSVKSHWVEREIHAAREREDRENRTVLFPVRIDDAVMDTTKPWASDIRRSRHIGDFTRWKEHAEYQHAFDRLMRDLRASASCQS